MLCQFFKTVSGGVRDRGSEAGLDSGRNPNERRHGAGGGEAPHLHPAGALIGAEDHGDRHTHRRGSFRSHRR